MHDRDSVDGHQNIHKKVHFEFINTCKDVTGKINNSIFNSIKNENLEVFLFA